MSPSTRPSAELLCVHPDHVPMVWPAVRDMLNAAYLKTDLCHTADLERDVLSGVGVLWLAASQGKIEAAVVTVLNRTNSHLVCVITACGGASPRRWIHMLSQIECWAKSEGATKMRILGREGWLRLLESYRVSNVVMEKSLV